MDMLTLNPPRARRRCFSREFKAQIVAACKQPGTSVAAIARVHDIHDNVVHRWLREAAQAESALWPTCPAVGSPDAAPVAASFVPVQISASAPGSIHLELHKNDLTLRIDWPASQAVVCVQFLQGLLR